MVVSALSCCVGGAVDAGCWRELVVVFERASVLQGTALGDVMVSRLDGVVFLATGCCGVRGVRGDGDGVVCSRCGGPVRAECGWMAVYRHPVCVAVVGGILARAAGRVEPSADDRRDALRLVKTAEAWAAGGGGWLHVVE